MCVHPARAIIAKKGRSTVLIIGQPWKESVSSVSGSGGTASIQIADWSARLQIRSHSRIPGSRFLPNRTHNSRFIYPISSFSRRLFFPLASFPAPNTSLPFPSHTALPSPSPHLFLLSSPSSLLRPSFSLSLLLLSPLQSIPPPIGVDLDVPQTSSGPRRANARCTSASGGSASWPTRPAWSAQRSPAARHTPYQRQRPQHSRRHERPCSRASSARRAPPCRYVARGAACGSSGRRSGRWARKRSGGGAGICTPCDSEAHESERGDMAVDRCVVPCPCTPSPWFCVLFPLRLGFVFRMTPCPSLSG